MYIYICMYMKLINVKKSAFNFLDMPHKHAPVSEN